MAKQQFSPEDQIAWAQATKGVVKLRKQQRPSEELPDPKKIPVEPSRVSSAQHPKRSPKKKLVIADNADIDRNTRKKMDRGQFEITKEIDLHGLSTEEAFNLVKLSVEHAFYNNERMILIITGKGKERPGTLRANLPQWLNHESIKPMVLRFNYATIRDGGNGAFYVLLRRPR